MRCENCYAFVSFWMALRQSIPYRFQCFACNARYRVSAPYMNVLFIASIIAFAGMLLCFKIGFEEFGYLFVAPFMVLTVGVWLTIEFAMYKYIFSKGRLIRLDKVGQEPVGPETET